ncbi:MULTISPECIES: ABC transporter substrate-binding protein [Nitrosomonas]|uniref:NitT/TauT family transport system substrate-binding protein n=2 Tax=Nitrosomonas eutropha TaxID=916 RepID=A0ABX5MAR3_9PROT|nr:MULTISPECIES: ABC transporter substrate-binding protein [Nitrosomonas]ABI60274.1 putative sulfonate binding protein precursor [Nitrosomonas eutropha C91]MXS80631.1 ABC transporter substrate-binding protein [Nitrosomonas sp. GH22]PXV81685.1 NitT/TauT family transport system substrate-binding protein [Nitrosomonas eutropha]SDW73726.1 NitT/TauT family transport system substrate-binding protein [Nitrosomonas eutropha]SEI72618.1 NitT/TauT family transport system substrate-binding protein [Nitros
MIKNIIGRLIRKNTTAPTIREPGNALFIPSRRRFLCTCGCGMFYVTAAGAGLLAAATRTEAAAGGTVIRVGHLPAGCVSHLLLAKVRGKFTKAGLNVVLTQFNSPGDAMQSLIANNLEIIHSPWTMTAAAYTAGTTDLRIIGGSGQAGIELVARNGSVRSVEEFIDAAGKGLRVGTLRLDTLELVGYGTMSQHGKSYDDYHMTFFPSMIGMGEAIANKALDVCTLAQPYAEHVVAEQGAVYLTDSNSVWGPEAADCVVTTRTRTIDRQQDVLRTYLLVLQESARAFAEDYETVLDDLQPIYGVPRPILSVALKRQFPNPVISQTGVNGLRQGAKYLTELGYLKPDVIDTVLDLQYQPA